jgi:glycosyltransferase involved in cell wall biosynthesis
MNVNQGGFSQTLYNIFSFLKPEDFLLITSLQANIVAPSSSPFTERVLTYNLRLMPVQRNRLGKFVNPLIRWLNYSLSYMFKRLKSVRTAVKNFNPDVVVVAPNGPDGVFLYHLLKDAFIDKKVFPYFMDDWLYQSRQAWMGGNIHALAKELLRRNTSWMMISESLGDILAKRYTLQPVKMLAIHNPVNMDDFIPPPAIAKKSSYTIAYAGALWQMHFDAFMVIAEAVKMLKQELPVRLVVYTGKSNWNWRRDALEKTDAEYGGHIPYAEIHSMLAKADCCLLTSSFTQEWQTHSRGSVQTNITDYLKAGRLIISCGPAYSANHRFLKKYQCGVCIETNDAAEAANSLKNILENIETHQSLVVQGYKVLQSEFSFDVVHEKIKQFLAA